MTENFRKINLKNPSLENVPPSSELILIRHGQLLHKNIRFLFGPSLSFMGGVYDEKINSKHSLRTIKN